jgi:protocatechuate 3,4-dioxygenase beta subunit
MSDETPTSYVREPATAHPPLDYPPYKSTALRHPRQPLVYLPHTRSHDRQFVQSLQCGPVP